MRRALTLFSALALLMAASYANRVKIETRNLEKSVASLRAEVTQRRAAVATLNAEWAYLNRPERLLRLASVFGEEMELQPRRPDAFARVEEIPISGERLARAVAPTPQLDLSDLEAPVMGALNPEPPQAVAAEEAPPLFPDYEEVVAAPEFVGEGVGEGLAEGALDPYSAALVESQALPPPLRSGPVAGIPAGIPAGPEGFAPAAAFAPAAPAGFAAPAFAPPGYAPQAGYAGPAPMGVPVGVPVAGPMGGAPVGTASGYALPPGAIMIPAQGQPSAYPSAPAGFAPPTPYNASYGGVAPTPAAPFPAAAAPQPVFAPNPAPPPRIEIWEPLP